MGVTLAPWRALLGASALRLCGLAALPAWAQQGQALAQARAAFAKLAPTRHFHEDATVWADLNGDGARDFATFVGDPRYNDAGVEDQQVAVFLGQPDRSYRLQALSPTFHGHERVSHALLVQRQSLILHKDGAGSCCDHWMEEFQFKWRDGQLPLNGLETADIHPEGVQEPDRGSSVNWLTGQVIKWTGRGKRRRETRSAVPAVKPVPLQQFDHERFSTDWNGVMW